MAPCGRDVASLAGPTGRRWRERGREGRGAAGVSVSFRPNTTRGCPIGEIYNTLAKTGYLVHVDKYRLELAKLVKLT